MVYRIDTNKTKTKEVIKEFLDKYKNKLHTDKAIEKSSLLDLYMIDNNTRYYIKSGYSQKLKDNFYRFTISI